MKWNFCPNCARKLEPNDKFCSLCGLALTAQAPIVLPIPTTTWPPWPMTWPLSPWLNPPPRPGTGPPFSVIW